MEAIVSRTRYISQLIQAEKNDDKNIATNTEVTRIIGLSTAIANPHDLADWMGINVNQSGGGCIGLYNFRPSVRPIPMTVHLSGYAGKYISLRIFLWYIFFYFVLSRSRIFYRSPLLSAYGNNE